MKVWPTKGVFDTADLPLWPFSKGSLALLPAGQVMVAVPWE